MKISEAKDNIRKIMMKQLRFEGQSWTSDDEQILEAWVDLIEAVVAANDRNF